MKIKNIKNATKEDVRNLLLSKVKNYGYEVAHEELDISENMRISATFICKTSFESTIAIMQADYSPVLEEITYEMVIIGRATIEKIAELITPEGEGDMNA
jgi:hypothetical protein